MEGKQDFFQDLLERLTKFLDSQPDVEWAYVAGDQIAGDDYRFDGGAIILRAEDRKYLVFLRKVKGVKI